MLSHELFNGKECRIHHHSGFCVFWCALAFFLGDWSRGKLVVKQILGLWVWHAQGILVLCFHKGLCFLFPLVQFLFANARFYAFLTKHRIWIACCRFFEIVSVPFLTNAGGVVIK